MRYTIEYYVNGKSGRRTVTAGDSEEALEKVEKWCHYNLANVTMQDTFRVIDDENDNINDYYNE